MGNSHGTRCAGEVSGARDNGVCGTGVAYDSMVAGIRMLHQPYMTDLIEANSMGHEPNLIDIYSASWGPTDDGRTVDGPRNATMRSIVRGVNEGRRGLGNIYVWASGDGGEDDDCNCDGYAASMWTISINSAINTGENAHYDESCSSTLASTFSNGAKDPNTGVATTDLYGKCTRTLLSCWRFAAIRSFMCLFRWRIGFCGLSGRRSRFRVRGRGLDRWAGGCNRTSSILYFLVG